MRWITTDDFVEVWSKIAQRGWSFVGSKLTPSRKARTKSAFNQKEITASNWWIIPKVQERWNKKITGDKGQSYIPWVAENYLTDKKKWRVLSLGSGNCNKEIALAQSAHVKEVICVDLAEQRLNEGEAKCKSLGLTNMSFIATDVAGFIFEKEGYDAVLFNSSLHHFYEVEKLLLDRVRYSLKPGGLVIINEYVGPNRLQFPKTQIQAINYAIHEIPPKLRTRFKTKRIKKGFSGAGLLRMIIADPSECVDSASIIPSLHQHFKVVVEKPYGGNILMGALKDIAHHFIDTDEESGRVLNRLFEIEDEYLKDHKSDYVVGIYTKEKG